MATVEVWRAAGTERPWRNFKSERSRALQLQSPVCGMVRTGCSNLYQGRTLHKNIYITSQEEKGGAAQKKKEPPSAKTHNPFSHIRPENVCSGCLRCRKGRSLGGCGAGGASVYFITLCASALACTCVPDRASLRSRRHSFSRFLPPALAMFLLHRTRSEQGRLFSHWPRLFRPVSGHDSVSPLFSSSPHATRLGRAHSPVQ